MTKLMKQRSPGSAYIEVSVEDLIIPEIIYLCRTVVEDGYQKVQAVKMVDGVVEEWMQLVCKIPHAYVRCARCDVFHMFVSIDGFCRDCL